MILAQIIAIIFILFALSRVGLRFKEGRLGIRAITFWSLIWGGAIIFLFRPEWFSVISDTLGIGRIVDLAIYASIIFLFYLIFRSYTQIEELKSEITGLTRALALKDLKKEKKE
jgi:small membrane protein